VIIIVGVIAILYLRKRRKEGKREDEAKDEQTDTNSDEEDE
jgi:hypothetical protein